MPSKDSIKEEIRRFQPTKNTFTNCERLLRVAKFSGAECEQVADCIRLIQFMVKETTKTIKDLSDSKKAVSTVPAAPAVDESGLGVHLPEEK